MSKCSDVFESPSSDGIVFLMAKGSSACSLPPFGDYSLQFWVLQDDLPINRYWDLLHPVSRPQDISHESLRPIGWDVGPFVGGEKVHGHERPGTIFPFDNGP